MAYTPNFNDPRVRERIQRAIGFACGVMSPTKPHQWSTRYIDRWFGQSQNDLGRYIRNQLLIVVDPSFCFGDKSKCKEYVLNQEGVDFLCDAIGLIKNNTLHNQYPIVLQVAQEEYQKELATGEFTYNDKSSRLWHPLQNFKREYKRDVLEQNGYQFHYDIQSCAMTLIHQYSQQIPEKLDPTQLVGPKNSKRSQWLQGPMDLYLFALRDYLRDRTSIREQIAATAELDTDTVKRIINALLAGARLSAHKDTEIYQMLDGDIACIKFLQQHEYLNQLQRDIKTCWDYITPTLPRRSKQNKNNQERMLPISSRQKWGVYFELERRVLNEVREFLSESNNKHFLEHDGWSCENELDIDSLTKRVHERTGFQIEIETK